MFGFKHLTRLLKSALFAALVMPVVLAFAYPDVQDFGQDFLNASSDDAFWKGLLALYFIISMMVWMFWEARARENTNSS